MPNPTKEQLNWERKLDEWLESNGTDLSIHSAWLPSELKTFIHTLLTEQREEIMKEAEQYLGRINTLFPDAMPFVIFEGKADEKEKRTIYFQAFKDFINLIRNFK